MTRILAVGRMTPTGNTLRYAQGDVVVEQGVHAPLTAEERKDFEAFWPALVGPELTDAECNEYFEKHFSPHRIA